MAKKPTTPPDFVELAAEIAPVETTDNMAEAGRKMMLGDFVRMLSFEDGARSGKDIEDLHQMRVSTRRMRSAFRLLEAYYKSRRTRPFTGFLKKLAARLGSVRDLDVLIDDLEKQRPALDEPHRLHLQATIDTLKKQRRKARKKLVALLDSKDYLTFTNDCAAFLTKPGRGAITPKSQTTPHQVRHVLPREIHAHLADVRAYDTVLEDAEPAAIHALRIEFKRLRYIVDYFKDVLGTSGADYVKSVKLMQDLLGRYNDIAVAHSYLEDVSANGKLNGDAAAALDAYLARIDAEAHDIEAAVPEAWAKFNTRTVQSKLSNALLVLR